MNTSALFKIGYGLYVLTANEQGKDNGCIVNTVMQITSEPLQVAVCVNKNNYTCRMIQHTRKFNISVLTEETGFDVFKNFGYQSGQNTDKFTNFIVIHLRIRRWSNDIVPDWVFSSSVTFIYNNVILLEYFVSLFLEEFRKLFHAPWFGPGIV